jgi:toxin ParE1/3/4
MKIEFLEPAKNEFIDAVHFYNDQSEGLGYEFAVEIRRTIERIIQYPEAWPLLSKQARRCRTNRFPYGLIYQIRENYRLIVAVMHLSRNPVTWKKRFKK